jgi:hypothetical protein
MTFIQRAGITNSSEIFFSLLNRFLHMSHFLSIFDE